MQSEISEPTAGLVGFLGLKNKSFINATIQCLIQSPYLTDYFLNNKHLYIQPANQRNADTSITLLWISLLNEIFMTSHKDDYKLEPVNLIKHFPENAFHAEGKRFLFLSLGKLHEDSLQINNNESIIANLLRGYFRIEISCMYCRKSSHKLAPFQHTLSVIIPNEKYTLFQYTFIDDDAYIAPTVYQQKIQTTADVKMLKTAVADTVYRRYKQKEKQEAMLVIGYIRECEQTLSLTQLIPPGLEQIFNYFYVNSVRNLDTFKELFVCEVRKSKIVREYRLRERISNIDCMNEPIYIYVSKKAHVCGINLKYSNRAFSDDIDDELVQKMKARKWDYRTYLIQHLYVCTNTQTCDGSAIGYPQLVTLPLYIPVTMQEVYDALWRLIKPMCCDTPVTPPFEITATDRANDSIAIISGSEEVIDLFRDNLKFIVNWQKKEHYKEIRERPHNILRPLKSGVTVVVAEDLYQYITSMCTGFGHARDSGHLYQYITQLDLSHADCNENYTIDKSKHDPWNAPQLLILRLVRIEDNNIAINIPLLTLDLSSFYLGEESAVYELYAVTELHENIYTATTKNLRSKQWYYFQDDTFEPKSPGFALMDSWESKCACVLYYCRRY